MPFSLNSVPSGRPIRKAESFAISHEMPPQLSSIVNRFRQIYSAPNPSNESSFSNSLGRLRMAPSIQLSSKSKIASAKSISRVSIETKNVFAGKLNTLSIFSLCFVITVSPYDLACKRKQVGFGYFVVVGFVGRSASGGKVEFLVASRIRFHLTRQAEHKHFGGRPKREREALKPDFPFCPRIRLRLTRRAAHKTFALTRLQILQLFTHKL